MTNRLYAPISRPDRLCLQVATQLRNRILSQQIGAGDRLPAERDLCEQFGASRTVIREAIRMLEAEGLLTSLGGSGTYVKHLQSQDVAKYLGMYASTQNQFVSHSELMQVRRVLEGQLAALAAENATPEQLDELQALLDKMEQSVDDPKTYATFDLEFHFAIAAATGNGLFGLLLEPLREVLYEGRYLASSIEDVPRSGMPFHRMILERIRARDAAGAAEAMARHLERSNELILQALKQASGVNGDVVAGQTVSDPSSAAREPDRLPP